MPDIPENVPIYIVSDHDEDNEPAPETSGAAASSAESKRRSLMEDRSAGNWQPYTKDITVKNAEGQSSGSSSSGSSSSGASGKAKPSETQAGDKTGIPVGAQTVYVKKKTMEILLLVTAVNMLAVGLWAGNQLLPHAPVTSSIDPVFANLFDSKSKIAPANIMSDIVARTNPCVVTLDIRMIPKMVASPDGAEQYNNPSSEMMPNQATGLIIRSDGYILTCAHAFKNFETIDVTFHNHKTMEAKLIGKDDFTDLAVVKVEAENLPVLKFADISEVRPGDWVVAVGSPVGLDHTVTTGVVSAADRSLQEVNNNRVELIQHDALLYIGSSGGPLLNIKGEVIGINAAVRGGTPGISFSVPADAAAYVSRELVAHGSIARPYMGLVMEDVDPNMTRSLTLPSSSVAVRVTRVEAKGPAEAAGLKAGDLILKVKGVLVRRAQEVRTLTRDDKPGKVIELIVKREGKELPINLELGDFAKFRPHG